MIKTIEQTIVIKQVKQYTKVSGSCAAFKFRAKIDLFLQCGCNVDHNTQRQKLSTDYMFAEQFSNNREELLLNMGNRNLL